ncbi:uncharacterized protein LMH87_008700 [Akanthomyces muscarius]|uniref:Peptidase M3A/M3B catalytic domain-containing protein n=1 Tax=Akanthomyces muscarius TaxID=2231603 RepID=A0A9W8QGV3_AKAMU|nr:uncharacterized protein LMH87_008700 [Akanthomyces muscarius]KAJ4158161.1 hypothetical protein LMH87_008700 [Akanthomyces muscarius]
MNTNTPSHTPPQSLHPFNGTPDQIVASDKSIQNAHKALLNVIVAKNTPKTATFDSILRPILLLEDASAQEKWGNFMYHRVSPYKPVREASRQASLRSDEYEVDCGMREDVFRLIDAAYATRDSQGLDEESLRLLERERRKYIHNGLLLPEGPQRLRFKEIRRRIDQLCGEAMEHLDESTAGFWAKPETLEGVLGKDIDIIDLEQGVGPEEGKESTRRDYFIAQANFANTNAALFQEIVALRDEAARMLGYPNHASLRIADKMAKTPETVDTFLRDLVERTKDGAQRDIAQLLRYKRQFCQEHDLDFDGRLYRWDRLFYDRMRKNAEFGVDDHEIAEYFPVASTIDKMLSVFARLLGLVFVRLSAEDLARLSPTGRAADVLWHDEVQILAVWDDAESGSGFCGYLYLDLFPRAGKYKQDMTLTLGPGCIAADGARHYASTALVCNLTRPSLKKPALLKHEDVVTVFHELGHAMATLCGRTRYERSLDLPQDGVEIPSAMLEHWCWDARVLARLSSHWKTGAAIPDEMVARLAGIKSLHATLGLQGSLVRPLFDLRVHTFASREDAETIDCGVLYNQIEHDTWMLSGPAVVGMGMNWGNLHLTYDHLLSGYDAGYYTYCWSEVIAADMFYSVFQQDPLSRTEGQRYRRLILERGGSRDLMGSLCEFLGRETNPEAFQRKELVSI